MAITTKNSGLRDSRCGDCFRHGYNCLLEKHTAIAKTERLAITDHLEQLIFKDDLSSPELQQKLNRYFKQVTGIADPYSQEKRTSNAIARKLYDHWKPKVQQADNAMQLALRLAIAGNIMDYGALQEFDLEQTISEVIDAKLAIDHSEKLFEALSKAAKVLYLCDNAGEIFMDKLFIETLNHKNITAVVRGFPILNDVTITDAHQAGIHEVAKLIDNGSDAPSTILNDCSAEFIKAYKEADLIISKGQGNLEGLLPQEDTRIFFLLMVKCDVIANLLHINKGDLVVYNQLKPQ
jgi:uncharacterized protein with ATP-grasp and redox domains